MIRTYSHYFDNKIELFLTQADSHWSNNTDSRQVEILNYSQKNKVIMPNQIHSDKVLIVAEDSDDIQCDAIIYNSRLGFAGAINVADCVPICIYDSITGYIALIHSGWKGTLKKIAIKTLNKMLDLGVRKDSVTIFIGPSIRGCCYEVEDFFASKFYKSSVLKKSNLFYVDLISQILQDLEYESIPRDNIFIDESCTFEDLNLHSFRRDANKSGRMSLVAYMKCDG